MTVVCKVNCPYNDRGFCARGITAIDENGMCEVWWCKGRRRANSKVEQNAPLYREDLVILNVEDVKDESQYRSRNNGTYGSNDRSDSENSKQLREDGDKSAGTRGNETEAKQDGVNDKEDS